MCARVCTREKMEECAHQPMHKRSNRHRKIENVSTSAQTRPSSRGNAQWEVDTRIEKKTTKTEHNQRE